MQLIQGSPETAPMGFTLLLAIVLHAIFILGVGFRPGEQAPETDLRQTLQVVLVRPQSKPEKQEELAKLLAQADSQGSGESGETEPAATSAPSVVVQEKSEPVLLPQPPAPPSAPVSPSEPAAPAEPDASKNKPLVTAKKMNHKKSEQTSTPKPKPAAKQRVTAAQLLASRSAEIARLTDELDRKSVAYANRPRRKAISASTTEYKYASYLEAWRRKVERIGNLNYPDEARRKRLFGNLLLHVAVRADGSVERVRILHSSGHKVLDDSAIRIVKLAAPFAPFPRDIREDTDILDITRTWQFLNSNRLGWK